MIKSITQEMKRKGKRYTGIFLFCAILGLGIFYGVSVSNAASVTTGTVNTSSNNLNVRNGAGSNYAVIGTVKKGSQVTILGEEGDWYKIQLSSGEGYVAKDYISNVQTVEVDDSYMNSLIDQGFPQSYAAELSALHSQYPNWVFEPVLTGLDWETVIAEESKLGRNLVQASNNDAQKSTETGAYNWSTNTWIGFDGANWVNASAEMIKYCMDPRNFLNDQEIFQFATNEYQQYQNADGVSVLLASSFMKGNYKEPDGTQRSYADTFVSVGSEIGVNPYHLAARCLQEQGVKGTSDSISGTVSGYKNCFNYFNIGAYPANGLNSVQNGLRYAKEKGWTTRYASILGGAENVGNNYIKKGQNTGYFQKFNVVNTASGLYGHQYMTNVQAAISEGKNMKKAYTDSNAAIVFRIPVYNNMPETATSLPNSGNPNNWIKKLEVKGYELTPGFKSSQRSYSLIVGEDVTSVTLSGTAVAATSSLGGLGTVKLSYGSNKVTISCTAQNQTVREYTIEIIRQQPETTLKGDINGDGSVSLADWVMVKRHLLEIEKLTGDKYNAADVNGDGSVTLADWVKIKRHILGYESLN